MFSSPDMRDFSEFAHASAFRTYDLSDGLSGEFYHVEYCKKLLYVLETRSFNEDYSVCLISQ